MSRTPWLRPVTNRYDRLMLSKRMGATRDDWKLTLAKAIYADMPEWMAERVAGRAFRSLFGGGA